VLGTLPVNLAAEVCERGGRYLHLSLDLPPEFRGRELTPADMQRFGARLEEFSIHRAERGPERE
jgi:CRISPR-associated protein Csx16